MKVVAVLLNLRLAGEEESSGRTGKRHSRPESTRDVADPGPQEACHVEEIFFSLSTEELAQTGPYLPGKFAYV